MATTDRLSGFDIGVAVKPACAVATTGNITLDSTQVIDGVAVGASERVLVKDQTDATENGIYIAQSSSWLRAKDFDGQRDALPGTFVYVDRGTENAATFWVAESSSTALSITIGSSIAFTKINPSLSGVSSFSNDTLLPTTTAGGWRSALGIVEPGESLITSTSTGDARSAIDAQEDVITTRGDIVRGSTAGAAERLALGTKNYLLGSDGSDVVYFGGVSSRSSDFTTGSTDNRKLLAITASSTDITVSLPAAATGGDGLFLGFKKTDSSTNVVTVAGDGSETIDGSTTLTLYNQYETASILGDGSGWQKASHFGAPVIKTLFDATVPTTAQTFNITGLSDFMTADRIEIIANDLSVSLAGVVSIKLGDASDFTTGNTYEGMAVDESGVTTSGWSSVGIVTGPTITASQDHQVVAEMIRLPDGLAEGMFGSSQKAWRVRINSVRDDSANDRCWGAGFVWTTKSVDRIQLALSTTGNFLAAGTIGGIWS